MITYQIHGQVVEVSPSMDLTVYRIVQEALTNVRKHSKATSAVVDITFGTRELEIDVVDDGGECVQSGLVRSDEAMVRIRDIGMRERARVFRAH